MSDPTFTIYVWFTENTSSRETFTGCKDVDTDSGEASVDIIFTDSSGRQHTILCNAFHVVEE